MPKEQDMGLLSVGDVSQFEHDALPYIALSISWTACYMSETIGCCKAFKLLTEKDL